MKFEEVCGRWGDRRRGWKESIWKDGRGGAGEVNARMDCYNEGVDRWGNKSYKSITTPSKEKG